MSSARRALRPYLKSAHEVLGPNVTVRVEMLGGSGNSRVIADEHPTSAYAWVAWDVTDPRVAHLRCYIPDDNRWVQRDVSFTDLDPENERGRTLGFVIGSIFVAASAPQPANRRTRAATPPKSMAIGAQAVSDCGSRLDSCAGRCNEPRRMDWCRARAHQDFLDRCCGRRPHWHGQLKLRPVRGFFLLELWPQCV